MLQAQRDALCGALPEAEDVGVIEVLPSLCRLMQHLRVMLTTAMWMVSCMHWAIPPSHQKVWSRNMCKHLLDFTVIVEIYALSG